MAIRRAKPQFLHHTGTKTLDQDIGLPDQAARCV